MNTKSRLPKPSGLPVPKSQFERPNVGVNLKMSTLQRLPLTQDLVNLTNPLKKNRANSPDIYKTKSNTASRCNIRRSRSAFDLRDHTLLQKARPLKRLDTNLGPIAAKITKTLSTVGTKSGVSTRGTSNRAAIAFKNTSSNSSTLSNSGATAKPAAKRIPPYDYKARFNDLLEKHKVLKASFEKQKESIAHLDTLPDLYEESQTLLESTEKDLKNVKHELVCIKEQNQFQYKKIESLERSLQTVQNSLDVYKGDCEKLTKESVGIKAEVKDLRYTNKQLSEENEFLKNELEDCKEQIFRANYERKELHNTVMDLRGNIRVFCRVRPALDTEVDRQLCKISYLDECSLEISSMDYNTQKQIKHDFSFDQVFHPRSAQEDIFEMVSPLIQSALDGYNVCIFAYGQTGSGKTFTMDGTSNSVGIIPRTVDLLFEAVKNYKRFGWEYVMKATFLEIYNETLYDLLNPSNTDLDIRMANAKNKTDIYVSNLTEQTVTQADQLYELMQLARSNRATASTAGNERSSRSHAVTRIQLIGTHAEKDETCIGTVNLVDLAGSESPKTSTRMDETKNINRSLSELTNVVLALIHKQEHIPYRNSKLTYLLMPSLGGNSKTLMFINIAPLQDCFVESVKSLRFAASVNSCKLNKTKKNKVLNTSNF